MKKANLMLLSAAAIAASFLVVAGCTGESDDSEPPAEEQDGGQESSVDAGDPDVEEPDASIADAKEDRRIDWDSGVDAGTPVVLDMWTRGTVYCARVQRMETTTVECWGSNRNGELGRGQPSALWTTMKPAPIASPEAATFKVVRNDGVMRGIACAVNAADQLKCWGATYGGLSPAKASVPDEPFLTNVDDVDMAQNHACARLKTGQIACWGGNTSGQLGLGVADYVDHPAPAVIPGFTADQVSAGVSTTCAVKDGEVWCWGLRALLGNGSDFGTLPTPTKVVGLSGITKVQAGQYTFALAADKTLWFWGNLGNRTAYTPAKVLDPTPDDPNHVLSDVDDVSGGCVRLTSGKVRCLPSPLNGAPLFNEIPRVGDAVHISTNCALTVQRRLLCWGDNNVGQLGIPSTVLSSASSGYEIGF